MKTYLKIKDTLYPATFRGRMQDHEWNGRNSIAVTVNMAYAEAAALFTENLQWSLVRQPEAYPDADGKTFLPQTVETDYSDYCKAGPITDNRDGTVTAKMGKITAEEALAELMEVLA